MFRDYTFTVKLNFLIYLGGCNHKNVAQITYFILFHSIQSTKQYFFFAKFRIKRKKLEKGILIDSQRSERTPSCGTVSLQKVVSSIESINCQAPTLL
jgi:hypothetical protein